jgi:predicted RNase H-like HicB family nuclease
VGFFVNLVIDNLKSIKMSDLLETIERTEDGGFIVQLKNEDGDVLAEGQGDTYESALEDANSKL